MSGSNSSMHFDRANAAQNSFLYSLAETQESSATLDARLKAHQIDANQDKLQAEAEDNSAIAIAHRQKKLEFRKSEGKVEKVKRVEYSVLIRKEEADSFADQFSKREENRPYVLIGLDPKLLSQLVYEELGTGITEEISPDEVIAIVRQRMSVDGASPDVSIVDKALQFLIEMTERKIKTVSKTEKEHLSKIQTRIEKAKVYYETIYEVELRLAPELIEAASHLSESTKEGVRKSFERCREIVHNPPDLQAMRKYYEGKGYKAMLLELKGLSAYLGGNFKRKNLDHPELAQLASAARKMQALLGVFRQSKIHLSSMESYLELSGVLAA
jgi:hypothetical protein